MSSCHPDCDRCDGCDAHILPGEPRLDVPAVAPHDDPEFGWGDRAYHYHAACDPAQWDAEGPHPGCREFAGDGARWHSERMHRARGCLTLEEEVRQ